MKHITDSITINVTLFKDLTGIEIDAKKLALIAEQIGTDFSKTTKPKFKITLTQLMDRYKIVQEKVEEVLKSVERGEMEKRILADPDSVLSKKPMRWAAFTANFIPDINALLTKLEQKHEALKKDHYIGVKNGKAIYKSA